jgi:hypothetical protein
VKHVLYMIVVSALMFACGKKNEGEPAATPTPQSVEPAGSAAAADPAAPAAGSADPAAIAATPPAEEEVDVPTEVDFEELASAEINDKNMAARFAELEKELAE